MERPIEEKQAESCQEHPIDYEGRAISTRVQKAMPGVAWGIIMNCAVLSSSPTNKLAPEEDCRHRKSSTAQRVCYILTASDIILPHSAYGDGKVLEVLRQYL